MLTWLSFTDCSSMFLVPSATLPGGWVLKTQTNRFYYRIAYEISWTEIAQNFGSSTRRIKGSIAGLFGLWCNAVDGPKGKLFRSSYKICGPWINELRYKQRLPFCKVSSTNRIYLVQDVLDFISSKRIILNRDSDWTIHKHRPYKQHTNNGDYPMSTASIFQTKGKV